MKARAFTLIELLVVITIIVVLLALLTPALDKAIYQAELAVCAARLDGIATGTLTYAVDHKRRYPAPRLFRPYIFLERGAQGSGGTDFRPVVEDYIPINIFNDPLAQEVDLASPEAGRVDENRYVFSVTELWAGWGYRNRQGMKKMGDPFEYNDDSFGVLAGDTYRYDEQRPVTVASHPDDLGVLSNEFGQDDYYYAQDVALGAGPGDRFTFSRWIRGDVDAGLLDLNFALGDGSVERYDRVEPGDGRLTPVPTRADGVVEPVKSYIPRQ